jgi:hypothetical protein
VVAVDDPRRALNHFFLESFPFDLRHLDPSRTEEDGIEVNDRYVKLGSQFAGKCRFTCAT